MDKPAPIVRKPLEQLLAPIMFALSIAFLVLLAGLLHRHRWYELKDLLEQIEHKLELQIQLTGLALLWPFFLVEAVWRFIQRDRRQSLTKHLGLLLLIALAPPLRIGVRSQAGDRAIWLPYLGWREVDRELRRTLEKFFSVPMIVIALMVLPLLAIEYFWHQQVDEYKGLELFLAIGTAIIWFAFVIEFIIMVSVAKKKLLYSGQHWVDLAIILLPFVEFMPLLRLMQLGRMGRLHRLRGLALKLWRAVLLLEVVQRLTGQTLEKRLRKLKELHAAKEEELDELRQEIEELEKRIAQEKQAASVRDGNSERP